MFVLFSVTAFQDISMIMFFIMSLTFACENRFKLSAVLYACSIACKPMTLFLFPVYAYFIFMFAEIKPYKKNIMDIIIGMLYVFIPCFYVARLPQTLVSEYSNFLSLSNRRQCLFHLMFWKG